MALDRPTGHTVPIALEALPETCRLGASIVGPCAPAVVVLQLQRELYVVRVCIALVVVESIVTTAGSLVRRTFFCFFSYNSNKSPSGGKRKTRTKFEFRDDDICSLANRRTLMPAIVFRARPFHIDAREPQQSEVHLVFTDLRHQDLRQKKNVARRLYVNPPSRATAGSASIGTNVGIDCNTKI